MPSATVARNIAEDRETRRVHASPALAGLGEMVTSGLA
jgi:hypothetical protein